MNNQTKFHPYHLVQNSILPFLISINVIFLIYSIILYLNFEIYKNLNSLNYLIINLVILIILMFSWFNNIIKESYYLFHNIVVKKGLKLGFVLFIVSEIMFFFGFFWAYFYNALSPSIWIGGIWPPFAIIPFNPLTLPLANTGLLLTSGLTITYSHMFMNINHYKYAKEGMIYTLFLSLIFLYIQFNEFYYAPFAINDGIYGSIFFMITGLHGFHVIIGTIFIFVCYLRYQKPIFIIKNNIKELSLGLNLILKNSGGHTFYFFTTKLSTGFITASWYWHFVDIVWIYVFIFLYVFSYI